MNRYVKQRRKKKLIMHRTQRSITLLPFFSLIFLLHCMVCSSHTARASNVSTVFGLDNDLDLYDDHLKKITKRLSAKDALSLSLTSKTAHAFKPLFIKYAIKPSKGISDYQQENNASYVHISHSYIASLQQELQKKLLMNIHARPDTLSSIVKKLNNEKHKLSQETLNNLEDALIYHRDLKDFWTALLKKESVVDFLPVILRKNKLQSSSHITHEHLSFKDLNKKIDHYKKLIDEPSLSNLIPTETKAAIEELISYYQQYINTLCIIDLKDRYQYLSHIFIQAESLKDTYIISEETAYDLLSMDEYGLPRKQNKTGMSVVSQVEDIHAKYIPLHFKVDTKASLDPSMEWAVSTFHNTLFGGGLTPSMLLILKDVSYQTPRLNTEADKYLKASLAKGGNNLEIIASHFHDYSNDYINQFEKTKFSFTVQITPHVEGELLKSFLDQAQIDKSLWKSLDLFNVQTLLLSHMLTRANDVKDDNIIVIQEGEHPTIVRKMISIDNDRAFYLPILKVKHEGKTYHRPGMRNVLFCYSELMDEAIIKEVKDHFLAKDPAIFLLEWLKGLHEHNQQYEHLIQAISLENSTSQALRLPLRLSEGILTHLYQSFERVKELFLTENLVTPHMLLSTLYPVIGEYYKELRNYTLNEAISIIYSEKNYIEDILKEQNQFESLLQLDQYVQKNQYERSYSVEDGLKEFLKNLDFQKMDDSTLINTLEKIAILFPEEGKHILIDSETRTLKDAYLLHKALKMKSSLKLLEYFLSLDKDLVQKKDNFNHYSPLHTAYVFGGEKKEELIEFLIEKGADLEAKDKDNLTLLDLMIEQVLCRQENCIEEINLLINLGAGKKLNVNRALQLYNKFSDDARIQNAFKALMNRNTRFDWAYSLDTILPAKSTRSLQIEEIQDLQSRKKVLLPDVKAYYQEITSGKKPFIVEGVESGRRIIPTHLLSQLFDEEGNILKFNTTGRHIVGKIQQGNHHLYFKFYPELPGIEEAVGFITRKILGWGAPYSELFSIGGVPVLVSQGVKGATLKEEVKNFPNNIEKLDNESLSALILLTMIINPEDGKPDNFIVEKIPDQLGKYRLISIDNDHAFVKAVAKEQKPNFKKPEAMVQVKTILYCLDFMKEQIPESVKNIFTSFNPLEILEEWVIFLTTKNAQYRALFNDSKAVQVLCDKHNSYIGIPLQERAIERLYDKLKSFQDLLILEPNITHIDFLEKVEHLLASRYKEELFGNLPLYERFKKIDGPFYRWDADDNCITITESGTILKSSDIPIKESLIALAKNSDHGDITYHPNKALKTLIEIKGQAEKIAELQNQFSLENLKSKSLKEIENQTLSIKSDQILSDILKKISFDKLTKDQQQAIFKGLKGRIFRNFTLKKAKFLINNFFTDNRVPLDKIETLNLDGCSAISEDILPILSQDAKSLAYLNLSGTNLKSIKQGKKALLFKPLKRFIANDCLSLEEVNLDAPKLQLLDLKGGNKLKKIQLNSPLLQMISLDSCVRVEDVQITGDPSIKSFILSNNNNLKPQLLDFLKGNYKIRFLDIENCGDLSVYKPVIDKMPQVSIELLEIDAGLKNAFIEAAATDIKNITSLECLTPVQVNDDLLTSLNLLTNLKKLYLSINDNSEKNFPIAKVLTNKPHLNSLLLYLHGRQTYQISMEEGKAIEDCLLNNKKLKHLGIALCITEAFAEPYKLYLGRNIKNLYDLTTGSGWSAVTSALKSNNTIKELSLGMYFINNRIREAAALIDYLKSETTNLAYNILSNNLILLELMSALKTNQSIEHLDLYYPLIVSKNLEPLITVLKNSKLRKLILDGSIFLEEAIELIPEVLKDNNYLQELSLKRCFIKYPNALNRIAQILISNNNTLRILNLEDNIINKELITILKNSKLEKLILDGSIFLEESIDLIPEILKDNNYLQELSLRRCLINHPGTLSRIAEILINNNSTLRILNLEDNINDDTYVIFKNLLEAKPDLQITGLEKEKKDN